MSLIEVEMDIFSGLPNPSWILPEEEGDLFLKKLFILPRTSAKELSTKLGYRGFIVRCSNKKGKSLVWIQNGTVLLSQNDTNVYYMDQNRGLEQWLLNSGKFVLKNDLIKKVEEEILKNR